MESAVTSLPAWWIAAVAAFAVVQLLLLLHSVHRLATLWRWARRRHPEPAPAFEPGQWPAVTVQLPLYNERAVAERLIDAAAALDYPDSRLQVQVLDDSTDETAAICERRVAHWRSRGIAIERRHRERREGYKAGALAAALPSARGEVIVVFDADFVPRPDFLRRVVPRFRDPRVGMVQARWGHLNRDRSALTVAQALLLDSHFLLEHEARMAAGLFLNFNGTAGAWRRACIEDAGGWSHDTLTEDLDLSYRAQLAGWRFAFASDVEVPAELPSDVLALKTQQRRWSKGSIQTARKILPGLLRRPLPLRVKLEATMHLGANTAYPLLLLSGLLLMPVTSLPPSLPAGLARALDLVAIGCGVLPVVAFLWAGQLAAGASPWRRPADVLRALIVGAGLTVTNSLAVLDGLVRDAGDWQRTPKTGEAGADRRPRAYRGRTDPAMVLELGLAALFTVLAIASWQQGRPRSSPFLLLLASGLAYVGVLSVREALGSRPAPPERTAGVRSRRTRRAAVAASLVLGLSLASPARAADPAFGAWWHDGKAELDGYRLTIERYGHTRRGRAVAIYVTEPFSRAKHVKLDDPAKVPSDRLDVLKVNLVRDFQTGIYDYHTLVSLFVDETSFAPVKIAFTSSEWCGQVYEESNVTGRTMTQSIASYFEGESAESRLGVPADGVFEDDLFVLLRGLRAPFLPAGGRRVSPMLASSFYRRLAHRPSRWTDATIERLAAPETVGVPAGTFETDVYRVHAGDGRTGLFHVERAYPHRIVRWAWSAGAGAPPLGGTDTGELAGSTRLEYWKTHDPGDEKYLHDLGLEPAVR